MPVNEVVHMADQAAATVGVTPSRRHPKGYVLLGEITNGAPASRRLTWLRGATVR
jgi:hypothetical protein